MRVGAGRAAPVAAVALAVVVALAGCAGRIRDGVFRSEHGFRVTLPGPEWTVMDDSRAELELRRTAGGAGILAHATCRPDAVRRSYDVLERHLLLGLRDRATLEDGEVEVAGRRAHRRVVEGRAHDAPTRVRIESYVLKGARCVYDLLYVASPAAFDGAHGDFRRFVQSFATE